LNWETGERVDNAVWITVFLVLVVAFNMLPVRVRFSTYPNSYRRCCSTDSRLAQIFGELEYILGCFKLVFIVMLIVVSYSWPMLMHRVTLC
jgi:amino acid transporter